MLTKRENVQKETKDSPQRKANLRTEPTAAGTCGVDPEGLWKGNTNKAEKVKAIKGRFPSRCKTSTT